MATILIVDDLAANREVLVTLLRAQGHRLIEARDGAEGLAAVQAEHPDLVITDVLMPVMDGYELVRLLRLDPATSGIPVVFYTANYGGREARALALSSGVSYVLMKPVKLEEVLKIVGRVLSGESETGMAPHGSPLPTEFDREHLRLLTDKVSEKAGDLRTANARLRALINIGLELASERDPDRLLQSVCAAARDLFGATYVTLGILDLNDRTVQRVVNCGADTVNWINTGDPVSGILGTVVAERRTLRGANPGGDPATLQLPLHHPEVQTFLAAPIASPAHVYGWICFVGNEGRTFSEDDEQLVTALSGQVGRIYENGYFHDIAQKRSEELEHELIERKRTELAQRASEGRYRTLFEYAPDGIVIADRESNYVDANASICRMLGYSRDELIGLHASDIVVGAEVQHIGSALRAITATSDYQREWQFRRKDGSVFPADVIATTMPDGNMLGMIRDVTERNQAVEALRTAEERMRFALEAAGVGIWDRDFTTGMLQWSEILESQYGLQPGTFGGTFEAFVELVHPQDRDALLETMKTANRSGADFTVQHRTIWPDGTVRWLSGAGRIRLDEHGEPVRGVGISLDVTERHTLEQQFHQAQKMEAVGRLAGGVAHDFNNLLTAILGYCELLLADLDPDDPRQADILEIQKAGASAAGLTRQLLAFSRKEIIEPTLLDLNTVVAAMRVMLGRLIGEDVTIVLGLRPELATVKADRGQVEQIVMNLAVNARDAMPRGGTLTIETENVELDEQYAKTHLSVKPGPYVALTVTDTGTGLTPQVHARLFEPFFTTKEPGKGTGLGLAMVHGIVTRSGGTVDVYSEVGRGASFKVYFPRADVAERVAGAPPPVSQPRTGPQTVLVVEDAEGLRVLAKRLLERQGYTVLVAADADEALQLFTRNASIDLLLTDVVMPGASGPELTRQLVERRPALKVIYMSGYTEDAIVQHGVLKPGIAFLHKPFTSETLGRKIREVLDR